jgi:hypothetical protein
MVSSGLLRRVALVRTDVSEEPGASFIRFVFLFVVSVVACMPGCSSSHVTFTTQPHDTLPKDTRPAEYTSPDANAIYIPGPTAAGPFGWGGFIAGDPHGCSLHRISSLLTYFALLNLDFTISV